jgi:hypothetical protein
MGEIVHGGFCDDSDSAVPTGFVTMYQALHKDLFPRVENTMTLRARTLSSKILRNSNTLSLTVKVGQGPWLTGSVFLKQYVHKVSWFACLFY